MPKPTFIHLNLDWNAEPNDPDLKVEVNGSTIRLSFYLNPFAYDARKGDVGILTFNGCNRWRYDATNDHAWFSGQGRFAGKAPAWGEFYEVVGDDSSMNHNDWEIITPDADRARHFLFYFRDEAIECVAPDWNLQRTTGHTAMTT